MIYTVRTLFFLICILTFTSNLHAQVAIGHQNPEESSILDVNASDKGILIPRVSLTDMENQTPIDGKMTEGLMVYNTNEQLGKGFYYWEQSAANWVQLLSGNSEGLSSNHNWYKKGTTAGATSIDDPIFTNGQVGINRESPLGALHVYEPVGSSPGPNTGTMVLEHGDVGGQSSILFRSRRDSITDYAYISYEDDGSDNGSSTENGLLTMGIQNDGFNHNQDDINIAASGSVGIANKKPNGNASLDLGSTNKGILINRVALTNLTSASPVASSTANLSESMLIYNTNTTIGKGFYYWSDNRWNRFQNTGSEKNIYNSNGKLTNGRRIELNGHRFSFVDPSGRGLHLDQPQDLSDINSPYTFFTNNSLVFRVDHEEQTLEIGPTGGIVFGRYGKGSVKKGSATYNLAVDANGNVVEIPLGASATTKNMAVTYTISTGLKYYSYNLAPFSKAPSVNEIRSEELVDASGEYNGSLSSNSKEFTSSKPNQDQYFAIKYTGVYEVKNTGVFNFTASSEMGARIYVDDALILNTWNTETKTTGSKSLKLLKGKHHFEFWYVKSDQTSQFNCSWGDNPDGKTGVINANDFTIE